MRQFVYTAELPGLKKLVQVKELPFDRFKHLIKLLTNDNNETITSFLDDMLNDLCIDIDDVYNCSFLDKLILILTIRSICIAPTLELTVTCPKTNKTFNSVIHISDVIQQLRELNLPDDIYCTTKEYNNGSLIIDLGMPNTICIHEKNVSSLTTVIRKITLNGKDVTNIKEDITDRLPLNIMKDIKEYILYFYKHLHNVNLISIPSPYDPVNTTIDIPLNLFTNSVIEFIKICFKRNLLSIYELEYCLLNRLQLDYELVKTSTPAELNVYINLLRAEEKEREAAEKKNNLNLP